MTIQDASRPSSSLTSSRKLSGPPSKFSTATIVTITAAVSGAPNRA